MALIACGTAFYALLLLLFYSFICHASVCFLFKVHFTTFYFILFFIFCSNIATARVLVVQQLSEPRHEKNGFMHMRKQRRRSASR